MRIAEKVCYLTLVLALAAVSGIVLTRGGYVHASIGFVVAIVLNIAIANAKETEGSYGERTE